MSGAAGAGGGDDLAAHWNRIYAGKPETELGWGWSSRS